MMGRRRKPKQSKGDVSSAFRMLPTREAHREFVSIVLMAASVLIVAEQNVAPVRAVSAVWAWHNIENLVLPLRAQVSLDEIRGVDDSFFVNKEGAIF